MLLCNEPTERLAKDDWPLDPERVGQTLDVGRPLSQVPFIRGAVVTQPMPTLIRHHDLSDVGEHRQQEAQLAAIDPWTAVQPNHGRATIDGLGIRRDRALLPEDLEVEARISDAQTHDPMLIVQPLCRTVALVPIAPGGLKRLPHPPRRGSLASSYRPAERCRCSLNATTSATVNGHLYRCCPPDGLLNTVAAGLGAGALRGCEHTREQALLRRQELDPDESSGVIKIEDQVAVCGLRAGRCESLRGDGADVVGVGAQAQVGSADVFVVGESHP